jgi:hypothetical protein
MNVRLAALTHAMLQVLLKAGVQREYAIELIGTWKVCEMWARVGLLVAGLKSGSDETLMFRPDAAGWLGRPDAPVRRARLSRLCVGMRAPERRW